MKKRLTTAEKLQVKTSLEQFILHPGGPCKQSYLNNCNLCLVQQQCGHWADKKVKNFSSLGEYRKEMSIQRYRKEYGEAALFELIL